MNAAELCLLALAIGLGLVLAGYPLAAFLADASPADRFAVAALSGLAALLAVVSLVNVALPLDRWWSTVCLAPIALTLVRARLRRAFAQDVLTLARNPRARVLAATMGVFLVALLWPLLSRPDVVFYDGYSGHDAFFWVTGAEHLKRQNYLQAPIADPTYPLFHSVNALTGWRPTWGRMGAEGLLAIASGVAGASPLKIYVGATAALLVPWVAAVFLVLRTFFVTHCTLPVAIALGALQPMFVFFHGNANLPNLLGILCGALAVVATQRALTSTTTRGPWLAALALAVHGMLCSYPEILPCIALPCALLWLRGCRAPGWRTAFVVLGAVAAGFLLNPVSTIRAWHGLNASWHAAGHPENWANIFRAAEKPAWPVAMATLAPHLGRKLGGAGGALAGLVLFAGAALAIARARDRIGAVALFAGATVLLSFTIARHHDYGWQKTMQFSAVFWAALPIAIIAVAQGRVARVLGLGAVAVVTLATALNIYDTHVWSERKALTREWFELRGYARQNLRDAPVWIDSATFSQPFFHSMWATYFLTDSALYFRGPDPTSGGYLRPVIIQRQFDGRPRPRAILMTTEKAAGADAPALWRGPTLTLLTGG